MASRSSTYKTKTHPQINKYLILPPSPARPGSGLSTDIGKCSVERRQSSWQQVISASFTHREVVRHVSLHTASVLTPQLHGVM